MNEALIASLALLGLTQLFLAMPRHQQDWLGGKQSRQFSRLLRWGGFATITLAFLVAAGSSGWGYGTVAWLGWLSMAAALVVFVNSNRERILRRFGKEPR